MFYNIINFFAGYCDIRCLGVIECVSWNIRAAVDNEAFWHNLLDFRSPLLAKQPGISSRRVLKHMTQLVPMHFNPFPASEECISSMELQDYFWCVDIHYLHESVFSGFSRFNHHISS